MGVDKIGFCGMDGTKSVMPYWDAGFSGGYQSIIVPFQIFLLKEEIG